MNEQVIVEATTHEFQQLMHILYMTYGTQQSDMLHALINRTPQDTQFLASILPLVANITFLQTVKEQCNVVFI